MRRIAAAAMALGAVGCWGDCEPCASPAPQDREGAFTGEMVEDGATEPVPVEATLADGELLITYVDATGDAWEVRYAVGDAVAER